MIGNLFKIIIALILGFFVGLALGSALGLLVGLVVGFFYQEIVYSGQELLLSIVLALLLAGLMGSFATQSLNKMFETEHNHIGGALRCAVIGIGVIFFYGIINTPDPDAFNPEWYFVPLGYCVSIGAQIGSIIFAFFSAGAVVQDLVISAANLRKARERKIESKNELSFYKSQNFSDDDK